MVMHQRAGWRKRYYKALMSACPEKGPFPDICKLPVTSTGFMYEVGGASYASGFAFTIATASGKPNRAIPLFARRRNGLHSCTRVWNGCYVCIVRHKYSAFRVGVYRIIDIHPSPDQDFATAECKMVFHCEHRPDGSEINPELSAAPGIRHLIRAAVQKSTTYACSMPTYFEPFVALHEQKHSEQMHLFVDENKRYDEVLETLNQPTTGVETYASFKHWFEAIVARGKSCFAALIADGDRPHGDDDKYKEVYAKIQYTFSGEAITVSAAMCGTAKFASIPAIITTSFDVVDTYTCTTVDEMLAYLTDMYNSGFVQLFLGMRGQSVASLRSMRNKKDYSVLLKYGIYERNA